MSKPDLVKDIDGREFYLSNLNPFETFDRIEVTLSHLFRERTPILGDRNYSDCLWDFILARSFDRPDIIEIGCGLGDLALNLLARARELSNAINSYTMYDISHALLNFDRERLGDQVARYIEADCLELARHVPSFNGLIISNGMIADLRSVYISPNDRLDEYGIEDADLEEFMKEWRPGSEGYYLHVGSLLFLRQISEMLEPGGVAIITEYVATGLNQPSFFENHYECGIDFDQILSYAQRLNFEAELVDIEEVLGVSKNLELLCIDAFTAQDRLAREVASSVKLWQGKKPLPIMAYSRETLHQTLESSEAGLSAEEISSLVTALDGHFHSVHDPRFDRRNPTTWGYRCLLLTKQRVQDIDQLCERFVANVLKRAYNFDDEKAGQCWEEVVNNPRMGVGPEMAIEFVVTTILSGFAFDAVKKYGKLGPVVIRGLKERINKSQLSEMDKSKVYEAADLELRAYLDSRGDD